MLAPPLLVSYPTLESYLSALSSDQYEEHKDEISGFVDKKLPPVVSTRCLATLFGFSVKFLSAMRANNKRYYRDFTIRKGCKKRRIQAPKVALKVVQKWFAHHLSSAIQFPRYVYGFVPGKSAADAALEHCEARWVYSVDIEDFFPSTPAEVIKPELREQGYSDRACEVILPLCCYGYALAQGAPSSPVLSNLALRSVDQALHGIAEMYDSTYTRYADDIVFSGVEEFPEDLKTAVAAIFEGTCWNLNRAKEVLADSTRGQRLKVHGLLVHGDTPRLTKGYRNKIRAYEHLLAVRKVQEGDLKRLKGHINYAKSIAKMKRDGV